MEWKSPIPRNCAPLLSEHFINVCSCIPSYHLMHRLFHHTITGFSLDWQARPRDAGTACGWCDDYGSLDGGRGEQKKGRGVQKTKVSNGVLLA